MASSRDVARRYEADCGHLNQFFSGHAIPCNARPLLEIFTARSRQELKLICSTYQSIYHKDLLQLLSQQKTTFARVAYLRASEPSVRDADIARDALFGRRLDSDVLIEVMCARSSAEVALIKQAYLARYNASLERDVSSRTNGSLNEILLAFVSSSSYHGARVDATMAMCDAKTLYEAVESGRNVDRRCILQLLRQRSSDQLRAILSSYRRLYGQELARALKRKGDGGEFAQLLRAALRCAQFPERHFARVVRAALAGRGAAAREALLRAVVTRAGVDVRRANQAFAAKTGWTMESVVRNEFGGAGAGKVDDGLVGDVLVELLKQA